jgi:hypothetical protein
MDEGRPGRGLVQVLGEVAKEVTFLIHLRRNVLYMHLESMNRYSLPHSAIFVQGCPTSGNIMRDSIAVRH